MVQADFDDKVIFFSSITKDGLKEAMSLVENTVQEIKTRQETEVENLENEDFTYIKHEADEAE
jgi:hypothetical protein